jgi:hypothetical protein
MEFKMEKFKLAGLEDVLSAQKLSEPVILDTLPPEHFEACYIPGPATPASVRPPSTSTAPGGT